MTITNAEKITIFIILCVMLLYIGDYYYQKKPEYDTDPYVLTVFKTLKLVGIVAILMLVLFVVQKRYRSGYQQIL